MNFYPHHLGDHARRSSHLSLLEEGALRRLLDLYYSREAALPADVKEVCRLVRATSKPEREAVARMLREFFSLADDGWHQERADAEIRKCREKQAKARASAEARWSGSQTSDRNANASSEHMRAQCDGNAMAMLSSNQYPISRSQRKKRAKAPLSTAGLPTWMLALIDLWHEVLPELPGVEVMNAERQAALTDFREWVMNTPRKDGTPRATNDEELVAWTREYFGRARHNDFLMGRGPRSPEHRNWRCSIEFLLSSRGMQQVIEQTQEGTA